MALQIWLFSLIIAILLLSHSTAAQNSTAENKNLYLLGLIQDPLVLGVDGVFTGCVDGMNLAVDLVNRDPSMLPGYKVVLEIGENTPAGRSESANRAVLNFTTFARANRLHASPITVGPFAEKACRTTGALNRIANMVSLGMICGRVRRKLYPDLLIVRRSSLGSAMALAYFVKFIARWKNLAIFTSSLLINSLVPPRLVLLTKYFFDIGDYDTAMAFEKLLTDEGVETYFHNLYDIASDKTLKTIKYTDDIRIFAIFASTSSDLAEFFCEAYQNEMKGPRYLFFAPYGVMFRPDRYSERIMPIGCSRAILAEQMIQTLWVAQSDELLSSFNYTDAERKERTTYGPNRFDFEILFDNKTNRSRSSSYNLRHICYDTAIQTMVALNTTLKKLTERGSDFGLFSSRPEFLKNLGKESLIETKFTGVRGVPMEYSQNGDLKGGIKTILLRWSPDRLEYKVATIWSQGDDPVQFELTMERDEQLWPTPDNKPPRSQPIKISMSDYPHIAVEVIFGITAATLFLIQCVGIIMIAKYRSNHSKNSRYATPSIRIIGLVGCLVMDTAAILFTSVQTEFDPFVVWNARYAVGLTGLAMTNGAIFYRMFIFFHVNLQRYTHPNFKEIAISILRRKLSSKRIRNKLKQLDEYEYAVASVMHKKCANYLIITLLMYVVYIAIWLSIDPFTCHSVINFQAYDYASDVSTEKSTVVCFSANDHASWLIVASVINLLPLLFACNWSLHLRQRAIRHVIPVEFAIARVTVNFVTSAQAAAIIILYVLRADVIGVQVTCAATLLFVSFAMSYDWLRPTFSVIKSKERRSPIFSSGASTIMKSSSS